jgi:predicted chitinase
MLISPPFLPQRHAGTPDELYTSQSMQPAAVNCPGTSRPEGSFPVSLQMGWHGGTHLHMPVADGSLPVRCIADGEIVYARRPSPFDSNVENPQNYNPYGEAASWTDNGFVIIRHKTDIGEGPNAVNIEFYSVITHLSTLSGKFIKVASGTATNADRQVYRKDEIGVAGRVYGATDHIHLEIVCDDSALRKIVGRISGNLDTTSDGRTDAVYGDIYFHLSPGTKFYNEKPLDNEILPAATPNYISDTEIVVGIRYGEGDGAHPGGAVLTTYTCDGAVIGAGPVIEAEAEYNLLKRAATINTAYSGMNPRPTVSALYDLLRFGRTIGPDKLEPANTPHWRRVNHSNGNGWVNLNEAGVRKFSDADFPHWRGWALIDDDKDNNSQCNSAALGSLIRKACGEKGAKEIQDLAGSLALPAVEVALRRAICKFPSEWDRESIDQRWGWLKSHPQVGLEDADWSKFREHINALTVPSDGLPDLMRNSHWHWHPREFITQLRKCGWLSEAELSLTLPKYLFYTASGNPRTAITTNGSVYTLTRQTATARLANYRVPLNVCIRRYLGCSRQRAAIFLAQVILETAHWSTSGGNIRAMHEWGFGAYNSANPATAFYTAFYGRGIMQLTWAGLYKSYGEFRALPDHNGAYVERLTPGHPRITATSDHYSANPNDNGTQFRWSPRYDPDLIAEDPHAACDSGGFFWVQKSFSGHSNMNRLCDESFDTSVVHRANRYVNGGGNGYYERQAYAAYLMRYLTDDSSEDILAQISPPTPKAAIKVNFSRT